MKNIFILYSISALFYEQMPLNPTNWTFKTINVNSMVVLDKRLEENKIIRICHLDAMNVC